ncbi:hypothetical protein ABTY96_46795 [Streptomyces sp. NPDC096057]|uniref:hypothetical protein n=1 Tax=Streptomyces sp. NPDC096057 TaxID=3155543 RepID=UPI003329627F
MKRNPLSDVPGPHEQSSALNRGALTAEDHMRIIRDDQYCVLPGGDTQRTYTWLQGVRTGRTAVAKIYADELRDRVPEFGDAVRVLEEQKGLTHEEHMEVVRACGYALLPGGATGRTYRWLQDVRSGATPAAAAHVAELRAMIPEFGDEARLLEEQRGLTHEEHMEVVRACGYALLPGGATRRTYRWLQHVRRGTTPAAAAHVAELRAMIPEFGDAARVLEKQRPLTPEEHMQVVRACGYVLDGGGSTQQTYMWLYNVKTGVTPVPRPYAEELARHAEGFGEGVRVLEDQRILTPEEHMRIVRACDYVLARGGTTQQTYKWFQNVVSGSSRIARTYLREIEQARGETFPHARVIEEKGKLTQADHMKILRSRNFRVPDQGSTARTFDWLTKVLAGEVKNVKAQYAAEIAARTAGK